jgi:hypothetical protein
MDLKREMRRSGAGQSSRFSRQDELEAPVGLRRFNTAMPLQFQ